ncbi:hypothetical protein KCU65_g5, partial [Aureobasidium melanogenum]
MNAKADASQKKRLLVPDFDRRASMIVAMSSQLLSAKTKTCRILKDWFGCHENPGYDQKRNIHKEQDRPLSVPYEHCRIIDF